MLNYIRNLLHIIGTFLSSVINLLVQSFTHYDAIVADVNSIVANFTAAKLNVDRIISDIKSFELLPHWRSRVINVPQAVEQLKELYGSTSDAIVEFVTAVEDPVHQLALILKSESVDASNPQEAVNALSKATVKLGEVATMVHQVAVAFQNINNVVTVFDGLLGSLNGLDVLFLPQGRPKTTVSVTYRKRLS